MRAYRVFVRMPLSISISGPDEADFCVKYFLKASDASKDASDRIMSYANGKVSSEELGQYIEQSFCVSILEQAMLGVDICVPICFAQGKSERFPAKVCVEPIEVL